MNLADFIVKDVFTPRLQSCGTIVVYDPDMRYQEICKSVESEETIVVDATVSSIEAREKALRSFLKIADSETTEKYLLVYVPSKKPINDEEKQTDPFSGIVSAGSVFPEGDGDDYLNLCLRCKPDQSTEIHRVFASDPNPPIPVIDAIGNAGGWPILENLLKVTSPAEIIIALMSTSDQQKEAIDRSSTWVQECSQLLSTTLGMKWEGDSLVSLQGDLWTYILFSEFVFDLPVDLPESLLKVPCAPDSARQTIYLLCDRLREDRRYREIYMENAEKIEKALSLPSYCEHIEDLGERDTFPFEERSFLSIAVKSLDSGDYETIEALLLRHGRSLWVERGENQSQWSLLTGCFKLRQSVRELEGYLQTISNTASEIVKAYIQRFREADKLHREFEQLCSEILEIPGLLEPIVESSRAQYRDLITKLHRKFISSIESNNWPLNDFLYNADVFDKYISSELVQSGKKVALILVDSLRYELAVELQKQLQGDYNAELLAACAVLPSVTSVGMASLLPEAGYSLRLEKTDSGPVPTLGEKRLTNVNARMQVIKEKYGTRFQEMTIPVFFKRKKDLPSEVDLLILRTTEIDTQFEADTNTALTMILMVLRKIKAVLGRLTNMGFMKAVIATDHGFCISPTPEAGDVCIKPPGDWANVHERILLGSGSGDAYNFCLQADKVGIQGDYPMVAGPKAMVTYRTGSTYFHGGLSIQECIVPVLFVKLVQKQQDERTVTINLRYKQGAVKVRTRSPVIHISASTESLFAEGTSFEVLLEARNENGELVAQVAPGENVNAATGAITIRPGDTIGVPMRIDLDFEGKMEITALDPKTLVSYDTIKLETDFTV